MEQTTMKNKPEGFFPESLTVGTSVKKSLVPKCAACKLYKSCQSPKIPVRGRGKLRVLLVGDSPGVTSDRKNKHFVGESAQLVREQLESLDINMVRDCWMTNALICHTKKNARPTPKQIGYCRANLTNTIAELKPRTIILLGQHAMDSLIPMMWGEPVKKMARWVGHQIPGRDPNAWICPTYDPYDLLKKGSRDIRFLLQRKHLEKAFEHDRRPWKEIPVEEDDINVIRDTDKAAELILRLIKKGGTIAFDYETNMLKPDSSKAKIVCCSICWEGKYTFAFPWQGKVIPAMKKLFRSKIKKVAANLKFEERWTWKEFGFGVENWEWDTMVDAHNLDSRNGITGLKFQSFIRWGIPIYDKSTKPFFQAPDSNSENRIKEIDVAQLLLYNGLDSLLAYRLYELQLSETLRRGKQS